MTTGEQLSANSTVSNVSALTHLLNPSGTGGGGDIYINSNIIELAEASDVKIDEVSDIINIQEQSDSLVEITSGVDNIQIIEGEIDAVY